MLSSMFNQAEETISDISRLFLQSSKTSHIHLPKCEAIAMTDRSQGIVVVVVVVMVEQ